MSDHGMCDCPACVRLISLEGATTPGPGLTWLPDPNAPEGFFGVDRSAPNRLTEPTPEGMGPFLDEEDLAARIRELAGQVAELQAQNARLRAEAEYPALVANCPGIEIEPGVWSGCGGKGLDCPTCCGGIPERHKPALRALYDEVEKLRRVARATQAYLAADTDTPADLQAFKELMRALVALEARPSRCEGCHLAGVVFCPHSGRVAER
jgi:hypothetical protein